MSGFLLWSSCYEGPSNKDSTSLIKEMHLVQKSNKLREDPRKGRAVVELVSTSTNQVSQQKATMCEL